MTPAQNIPLKSDLRPVFAGTTVLIILFAALSMAGIVFHQELYADEHLRSAFLTNDWVNLIFGFPVLVWSFILTYRKNLLGFLCYPGALFYCTYIYATYMLGMPFSVMFIPYLLVVGLSLYTLIGLLVCMDISEIHNRLEGHVPVRGAGFILLFIAVLLFVYQIYAISSALLRPESPGQLEIAQWIVDLLFAAPPVMIVGMLMIRRKAMGYALGTGILFLLSVLFISLLPFMIIQSVFTYAALNFLDILVVAISSLICLIPFGLFVKGLKRSVLT